MRPSHFSWPALLALSLLAGCGGGGSESPVTANPQSQSRSTALKDNPAPTGFDFAASRTLSGLISSELVSDPSRFADAEHTYVSIWVPDAVQERLQLAFVTLAVLRALDAQGGLKLSVPLGTTALQFEVYDAGGAATALRGEIQR